jgi:hypothetical protein
MNLIGDHAFRQLRWVRSTRHSADALEPARSNTGELDHAPVLAYDVDALQMRCPQVAKVNDMAARFEARPADIGICDLFLSSSRFVRVNRLMHYTVDRFAPKTAEAGRWRTGDPQ